MKQFTGVETLFLKHRANVAVLFAYSLCALVMTYPLGFVADTYLTAVGDTLKHTWRIGWVAHQLILSPLDLFHANSYYAFADSFAFDDLMLTQGLFALPLVVATNNAVLGHNFVILTSFALSGFTMFLFGFYLTRNPLAAWLAGLVFAYSAFRMAHVHHMNLLMVQWIPLFFLGLDKLMYTVRPRLVALTIIALVLQAFASLMVLYLVLIAATVYVFGAILWRRLQSRQNLAQLAVVAILSALIILPLALPYARVARMQNFVRDKETIEALSATLNSYLAVPIGNRVWGNILANFEHRGNYSEEHALFFGAVALSLAATGLFQIRTNVFASLLLLMAIVAFVLSLGPILYVSPERVISLPFQLPYAWLYDALPGFSSLRAGARFAVIIGFSCAGLAALGAAALLRRIPHRVGMGLTALGTVLLLLENMVAPLSMERVDVGTQVPAVYQWLKTQSPNSAILELPIGTASAQEHSRGLYQYYSIYHWQPILTAAFFSYVPANYGYVLAFAAQFPSADSLAVLNEFQVKYVILHRSALSETERRALDAQIASARLEPVQQFGTDWVFQVPEASAPLSALRVTTFTPSQVGRKDRVPIFVLLTNPTSRIYFFQPKRQLMFKANAQPFSLALPLYLEPGTTILSAEIPDTTTEIRITGVPASTIPIPDATLEFERTDFSIPTRPVALELVTSKTKVQSKTRTTVELEWRVLDRIREPYKVKVFSYDGNGTLLGHAESSHAAPDNTTARWRPGEILRDTVVVNFPSADHFEVELYEPASQTRLMPLDDAYKVLERIHIPVFK